MAQAHNNKESQPRSDIWARLFRPRAQQASEASASSQSLDDTKAVEEKTNETVVLDSEGHRNRINHY